MNDTENKEQTFPGDNKGSGRRDKDNAPLFSGFEEEGEYEEPDRDTDYTSIYREDGIEDEEFADTLFEEEDDPEEPGELDRWAAAAAEEPADGVETLFDNQDGGHEKDDAEIRNSDIEFTSAEPAYSGDTTLDSKTAGASDLDDEDDWDKEDEPEEDEWNTNGNYYEDDGGSAGQAGWPLGLVAVAIIALLLVMAGGYGVIQQRSATQEELRRLQAALATSVSQEDVAQTRAALEDADQRNRQLQAMVDALNLENRRLTDTVAGLEAQLGTQRNALPTGAAVASATESTTVAKTVPAPDPLVQPEPEPQPESQPASPEPKAAAVPAEETAPPTPVQPAPAVSKQQLVAGGDWFVNFASYGVEATARNWVARLDPSSGRAVVTTGTKNERTFYRVRIVDLPDRESADRVARELEEKYRLSRLWVGRQQ